MVLLFGILALFAGDGSPCEEGYDDWENVTSAAVGSLDARRARDDLVQCLFACTCIFVDGDDLGELDVDADYYVHCWSTGKNELFMPCSGVYLFHLKLHVMTRSFEALVKDKEIIAAEVMSEYNDGVCPSGF
jgi:hypothetical protein